MQHIETITVTPYIDQKPGTSGLRKKTKVFLQPHYLATFAQAIFNALPENELKGATILVSGDGRYYSNEAIQEICQIAAANGVGRVWICENGLCSTPAASCIIRNKENGVAYGGIILTASHNPGGLNEDFGVKYNMSNGGPAPESVTNLIYKSASTLTSYKKVSLPKLDITKKGIIYNENNFKIEIISGTEEYIKLMKEIFDFELLKSYIKNPKFSFLYDGMNGVGGLYAHAIFEKELGINESSLLHCTPLPDFGGLHPDPNLEYAKELVQKMLHNDYNTCPIFGAAGDGDCDRNMILGRHSFVTPSDSVAIIASYAQKCIPYFKKGILGLARSMPTSKSLDSVAKKLNINLYEVPTGWKFFGNLMDANLISICGEESFGTGSNHIREKDGIWAVLCWLSILAYKCKENNNIIVDVKDIVNDFWNTYGRSFYTRYDYENVESEKAKLVMDSLKEFIQKNNRKTFYNDYEIISMDSFTYNDPVDNSISSDQGLRFIFKNQARCVYRLSGTGSSGATIRIYMEQLSNNSNEFSLNTAQYLNALSKIATKELVDIQLLTSRDAPTVIT